MKSPFLSVSSPDVSAVQHPKKNHHEIPMEKNLSRCPIFSKVHQQHRCHGRFQAPLELQSFHQWRAEAAAQDGGRGRDDGLDDGWLFARLPGIFTTHRIHIYIYI
jgi:hypothetical protein